jgi:succinate dehydrogenase / fumarate reductase iron-sulfur subunit
VAGYDLTLRLWRGDASGGSLVDYVVPVEEGMVVLDAVHRVQATQAGDLAVRWNCKAGKCGSCSAEIDGMPRLMCMTRLNLFAPGQPVTVTPMRTFPIVRDLVTDVSFNYVKARQVPAFAPRPRDADGTYRMQQSDIDRLQEFRKCIECFLCQNTCHVIRDHEENKPAFAGPRLFIRYAELDMHPLDTLDRRRMAQDAMGLGYCNITKCCTEVCPESIKITDNGIIPLKERAVDSKYDPVVWLTDRIMPRRQHRTEVGPVQMSGPVGTDPRPYDVPGNTLEAPTPAPKGRAVARRRDAPAALLDTRSRKRLRSPAVALGLAGVGVTAVFVALRRWLRR